MNAFEKFMWDNHLKQADVRKYLGCSPAAVHNVASGKSTFGPFNLVKLFNNPYGWDTSMLECYLDGADDAILMLIHNSGIQGDPNLNLGEDREVVPVAEETSGDSWYKMMFVELSKRVAEQDALISKLQERIKELENR